MKKILRLRYKDNRGYFSLMWTDYAGGGTGNDTRYYEYLFFPIRDLVTGEIVGFSNDGGYFPEDYPRIMQLLKEHPVRERYDVPGGFLQGEGPRDEPDEVPMCGNLYPNFKVKMGVVEGIWKCEKPKGHDTAEGHQNGALCWSDRG